MYKILFLLGLIAFCSCNNGADDSASRADTTVIIDGDTNHSTPIGGTNSSNASGCYLKVLQRDTMVVQLSQVNNEVTGKMTFDNYEKDGSTGTVRGVVDGSIIKLWYDFQSEGMNSVMEIWFKNDDSVLKRGIGSFGAKGDTSYYTNPPDIQYSDDQAFKKVNCESVPEKYR